MGIRIIDSLGIFAFCISLLYIASNICSIAFIPQSLQSLPATFSIEGVKKGYFPYLFCRKDNMNYIGEFPPADQVSTITLYVFSLNIRNIRLM